MSFPLRADQASPLAPKSDEEVIKEDGDSEEGAKDEAAAEDEQPEQTGLQIDLDGFETRAVQLPVNRGSFSQLARQRQGPAHVCPAAACRETNQTGIKLLDLKPDDKKEAAVLDGAGFFALSADGKQILVRQGPRMAIVKAQPKQKLDKPIDTRSLKTLVDPLQEWRQIFHDAWRMQRDFFYDPTMHGVDWNGIRDSYAAMLDDCATREDVSYVIREMISELNVGHAYYREGRGTESQPRVTVGMLGADLRAGSGRLPNPQDPARSSLGFRCSRPAESTGSRSEIGRLSAGRQRRSDRSCQRSLGSLPGDGQPDRHADAGRLCHDRGRLQRGDRPVVLQRGQPALPPLDRSQPRLRRREDRRTGRLHLRAGHRAERTETICFVSSMPRPTRRRSSSTSAGTAAARFRPASSKLLNRPVTNYWARRHGEDWMWPPDSHQGPKTMLINGQAGSGGDAFPAYFKQAGLGKLIGTRTWGGLVGISGGPAMVGRFVGDGAVFRLLRSRRQLGHRRLRCGSRHRSHCRTLAAGQRRRPAAGTRQSR